MESVADLLNGQNSSLSSSTSGSVNTSLDDWSDGSDEELDYAEDTIEMQVA
jgi:hypothetical protein